MISRLFHLLKTSLPQGLLGRSLLIIVLPMVVVQLVSLYVFYATHWDNVSRRLAVALAGDISAVVEVMRQLPADIDPADLLTIARKNMDLRIDFEPEGILPNIRQQPQSQMEVVLQRALRSRLQRPFIIDTQSMENDVAIRVQVPDGVLNVVASKKRLFSSTVYVFLLWTVGMSLIVLGIATIFMRNQVRSVRRLAVAADRFGKGLDTPNFKPEGAREVRQAASAFIIMRERIQRQLQQRTEMLAGVSHDLRTPLTRMKLQLAMMSGDDAADLAEDVAEMERMVEGYLAFARGEGTEAPQATEIQTLVANVVNRFARGGNSVGFRAGEPVYATIRPDNLSRVLGNLVSNGLRYGGKVQVEVVVSETGLDIMVDDDGPGIAPDRREEVFRPFHRLEASRNTATGGVGLGLTIARDIARGHGGDVILEQAPLPMGGLRARLHIPL